MPALRYWRDLDETLSIPVLSVSRLPFAGLGRGTHLRCDLAKTLPLVQVAPRPNREIHRADHVLAGRVRELFEKGKRSEPSLVRELSEWIPEGSLVYLGNSLPIREWDLYATRRRRFSFAANRGANGIDGQLSTFLGMAEDGRENWCVVGDLTAADFIEAGDLRQEPGDLGAPVLGEKLHQRLGQSETSRAKSPRNMWRKFPSKH